MLKLLFLLILSPLCLAAVKTPHERLVALADAADDGIIKLDEHLYDLVATSKRDFSAVVQFTALDKNLKCAPCREFDPSFKTVAKAWKTVPKAERDKHFFATLDFAEGENVFRKLGLMSAPVVTFYPATQGPNKLASGKVEPFNYDFNNFGSEAKELAVQMSLFTPVPIPFRAPINWGLVGSIMTTTLLAALAARITLPILVNRWTWAVAIISTILVMTSGFMFVRIRGMPYRTADATMIPGYQNQVGAEVYTVASKYFLLSSAFLVLILGAPHQLNKNYQRPAIYLSTIIIAILFSALIKDFKIKNGGYPFAYLF